jgi:Predicted DNA alkylation repair enzyme
MYIQQIRKRLYFLRDGVSSSSMRKKGVDYRVNLGVPVPRLKEIAKDYYPNAELANQLWEQNSRELKLLAILIQDRKAFEIQDVDHWVVSLNNIELAEQMAMNLLCKLPDINKKSGKWIQSEGLYVRITGFLVYMRLFMNGFLPKNNEYGSYFRFLYQALNSDSGLLRGVALNSIKQLGKQSSIQAETVLTILRNAEQIPEEIKFHLIEDMEFELENRNYLNYYT